MQIREDGMRWAAVRTWRDRLLLRQECLPDVGLSREGAREAYVAALTALSDDALAHVAAIDGTPFARAVVVVAGTVPTAAIEWCAVLLGRGTEVVVKVHHAAPGFVPELVAVAEELALPLQMTVERDVVATAPLVVAMGGDDTIAAIRASLAPGVRLLPHGHRFSAAWASADADWDALAADIALYDGRGCLSPVVVLSPVADAADRLQAALERAAIRWPVGEVSPVESAQTRARLALARVLGQARSGAWGSIATLPADRFAPEALPRSVTLVQAPSIAVAADYLRPFGASLSTVGGSAGDDFSPFVAVGATRLCRLGQMQRPPLVRPHDGEDWLRATLQRVSREL